MTVAMMPSGPTGPEFSRVAKVLARNPHGPRSIGSGYLVTDTLVLTAAHVILGGIGQSGRVMVVFPGTDRREWAARVAWHGDPERCDGALLQIVDDAWQPPGSLMPVRWGVLAGTRPGVPVQACGYPDAERQPRIQDMAQARGFVDPGTRLLGQRYEIHVAGALPVGNGKRSPWAGTSGAAVFCGPAVVGVVIKDRGEQFRHGRVTALPTDLLVGVPEFVQEVRLATGAPPELEFAELLPVLAASRNRTHIPTPAYLLRGDAEVVRFRGREAELAELRAWCLGGTAPVRLLVGAGGQGKTRLARQLATEMRQRGWLVGVLAERVTGSEEAVGALAGCTRPLLLIVDYAETRQRTVRCLLDQAVAHVGSTPVRLLLIARHAGDWWSRLLKESIELEIAAADAAIQRLTELTGSPAERRAAFDDAVADFAARMPLVPGYTDEDWTAAGDRLDVPDPLPEAHGSALAIQMAALSALLHSVHGGPARRSAEDVLLSHETRYWTQLAESYGLAPHGTELRDTAAAITLFGAVTRDEALTLAAHLPLTRCPGGSAERTDAWARDLYPASNGATSETADRWHPLEPDLLGEYLVNLVAEENPETFIDLMSAISGHQVLRCATVLSRALQRKAGDNLRLVMAILAAGLAHFGRQFAERLDIGYLDQAIHALGEANYAFTSKPSFPDDPEKRLRTLFALHDAEQQLTLLRTEVSEVLVGGLDDSEVPDEKLLEHANNLGQLGTDLFLAHKPEASASTHHRAVEVWRRLAHRDPNEYRWGLAHALSQLSEQLHRQKRPREALAPLKEAIAIYRQERGKKAWWLQHNLTNLGQILQELNRLPEAVLAQEEATALCRQLDAEVRAQFSAQSPPDAPGWPYLPGALRQTAALYTAAGRGSEAEAAAREEVDILRSLAADHQFVEFPKDSFNETWSDEQILRQRRSWLTSAMLNLSRITVQVGRPREAVTISQEAVAIEREDLKKPDLFFSLAEALNCLGQCLSADGRLRQAAAAFDESYSLARSELVRVPLYLDARLHEMRTPLCEAVVLYARAGDMPQAVDLLVDGLGIALEVDEYLDGLDRTQGSQQYDRTKPVIEEMAQALAGVAKRLSDTDRTAFETAWEVSAGKPLPPGHSWP